MTADDMEDVDVATKAPESDAQEQKQEDSSVAAEQEDQKKPVTGEDGTSDGPTTSDSEPKGEISSLNGIETYISRPPFYPSQPAKLLLLLSPGTGIHSLANKHQADAWASKGYVVLMPDQFNADPAPHFDTLSSPATAGEATATSNPSFLDRLKLGFVETAKSFRIDMWLARHTPATVLPRLLSVVAAAREMYADAVAYGGGIYGAGYCFGGRYILLLLSELPDDVVAGQRDVGAAAVGGQSKGEEGGEEGAETAYNSAVKSEEGMVGRGPWIKAGVLAHGTGIGKDDFAGLKEGGKLGIVAVKEDGMFTDEVRGFGLKVAKEKKLEVEERVWEGVPHGFAVQGEYADQKIVQAQKEAFEVMTAFLEKC
ncbi:Protein AIM2 [Elsinoe australis]|uniref:Protein AIM2 n=1 Tax=Elsinoe australis TaxID=40998 RepID=A0A2P8A8T9_9PEZI|nr:Protein AIM2 [Elsinoe australis]